MSEEVENHPAGTCGNQEFNQNDFDHKWFGCLIFLPEN
jgi:hypothetical protein